MTPLIAGIITSTAAFALTLWLLLAARKRRIAREHRVAQEAARIEAHNQLTNRLMATSLESRMAVTFVALAMINAGPCHLMNDKMRSEVPWIERFLADLVPLVSSVNDMSLDQIYTGPFEGEGNVLDILANNRKFMYFVFCSYKNIDEFLCAYWASFDQIYSGETRDAVRPQMVNVEFFVNTELKGILEELKSLTSA